MQAELEAVSALMQRHISANAHSALDKVEYQRQYDEYAARFEAVRSRISEVSKQREALIAKRGRIQSYLKTSKDQQHIVEFDEALYGFPSVSVGSTSVVSSYEVKLTYRRTQTEKPDQI